MAGLTRHPAVPFMVTVAALRYVSVVLDGPESPSRAEAATRALLLIQDHAGCSYNDICDVLYWMLPAQDTQALERESLALRCGCGRGLGYAHYHDGMILVSKDSRPQKRPVTSGSGVELIYRPSASVLEANSPRPAGYDAFANQAGEHGYLRRKVVCRRPEGCGADYPLVPERILVTWLRAVTAHETELRLGVTRSGDDRKARRLTRRRSSEWNSR